MKLSTEIEWPGSIKYYTVKTGNVSWKGCKMLLRNTNNVWCGDVMLKSNDVCPAVSFKLIPSTIKRIICKKRLVLEFQDGLMIQFNPNTELVDKVSNFFEDWKNNSTSPKTFNKAEVGISTPLCDKRINKTPSIERPIRHTFSGKENNEALHKEKIARKRDSRVFEETLTENGHDSIPSKVVATPKSNGEHFLQRGAEKSQETLASMKTSSFYGKGKSANLATLARRSLGNIKRSTTLNGESTPVKRQRLVNLSSNSQSSVKTENPTSASIYPVSKLALRGLTNLGNTCYLNAILQALYSLEPFVSELLYTNRKISKINPSSLHSAMANLLVSQRKIEPESSKCTLLDNVREAISTVQKRFSGNDMQDAHECLNQILDHLKEEAVKVSTSTPSPNREGSEEESLLINPTVHNFEFEVEHSITCIKCGEVVTKIEQYIDLSLDVPRGREPTIQDALDLFFANERVDYRCARCDYDKSEVSKRINKLPRVFILHLKRYAYSVVSSRHTKIAQLISIPKYLTLASHASKNMENPLAISLVASPLKLKAEFEKELTPRRRLDYSDSGTTDSIAKAEDDLGVVPLGPTEDHLTKQDESQLCTNTSLTNVDLQMVPCKDTENSGIFDVDLTKGTFDPDTIVIPDNCTTTKFNREESSECENGAKYMSSDELMALTDEEMINLAIENSLQLDHLASKSDDALPSCWSQDEDANGNNQFVFNPDPLNLNVHYQPENEQPLCYDVENKENHQPLSTEQTDMTVAIYCPNGETPAKVNGCSTLTQTEELKYDINQEDEDLRKAKEMSLIDLDDGYPPADDFGVNVDEALKRTKEETEQLKINAEKGNLPHSYQLVSVVAHIGNSSVSGHYLSDVLDLRTDKWYSFDDKEVRQTTEAEVQKVRQDSGYIFFYLSKNIANNLHCQHQKEYS